MMPKVLSSKTIRRIVRILVLGFGGLVILSLVMSLLLLIPQLQTFVTGKATEILSKKTGTAITVGGVHISFPKTIRINDVYAEDTRQDTLLYCQELDINAALLPLLKKNLNITSLKLSGVRGYAYRLMNDSAFNFSPIISALSSTQNQKPEKSEKSDWQLGFEEIVLENIILKFSDYRDSTFLDLNLGILSIDANRTDIANMKLDLEEIDISNTTFSMSLAGNSTTVNKNPETAAIPIQLNLKKLKATNLHYRLNIGHDKLALSTSISEAEIAPELIALDESRIIIDNIHTNGIHATLRLQNSATSQDSEMPVSEPIADYTFGNFDWNILVKNADLKNTNYKMDLDDLPRQQQGMDYMHMDFSNFNVEADSIFFTRNETGAKVHSLTMREISGPEIKHVSGKFFMNNTLIMADNIDFQTSRSLVQGHIQLTYPSLQLIGTKMSELGVESRLKGTVHLDDGKPFTTLISDYESLQKIKLITINDFNTNGTLGNISLKNIDVHLAKNTAIKFGGQVTGLPGNNLDITYHLDTLLTTKEDLIMMLTDTLIPKNIQMPESIRLASSGTTDLKNGVIEADLAIDYGSAKMKIELENEKFQGALDLFELNLGTMLRDSTLGKISLTSNITGEVKDYRPEQFEFESLIHSLEWNNNKIENSTIMTTMENEIYSFHINLDDTALIASIDGKFYQKDSVDYFTSYLEIEEVELKALNLWEEYFMIAGGINITLDQHSEDELYGTIDGSEIRLHRTGMSYLIRELDFRSRVNPEGSDFYINSDIFDASLTGNTRLNELDSAFLDHIDLYLTLPDSITSNKDFTFDFELNMKRPDFFTDFLITDLKEFQLDKCQLHYNDRDDILTAEIIIPALNYQNIKFKDLSLIFDTKTDSAVADLQLSELLLNSIAISKLGIHSTFEKNKAQMNFYSKDLKDSLKYQMKYVIDYLDTIYNISIDHESIVIKYQKWSIPEGNLLSVSKDFLLSESAEISNGSQKIGLIAQNQNLSVIFDNFNLSNITEVIVQDSSMERFSGDINGSLDFITIFSAPKIIGDMKISNLKSAGSQLGDLAANVTIEPDKPIEFDLELKNQQNYVHASGTTGSGDEEQDIRSELEINVRDASSFLPLFNDYISSLTGSVQGNMTISGKSTSPKMNGVFNFNSLQVTAEPTNTILNAEGQIALDNNLLRFNSFDISDSRGNPMHFTGQVNLQDFNDPSFDLEIATQNFMMVDSPVERKDIVEGKLNIGVNLKINGRKSKLNVINNLMIKEGTDIYYFMPGNDLELITDEGIVEYVDFDLPDQDSVFVDKTIFIGDSIVSLIEGIDFKTRVDVDPNAKFTVIVDPNSGDFTEFNLRGTLQYIYNDTQRGKLSGLLEFQSGFYELSFYGLVKKRFQYEPGSMVSWSGDVMDGSLNFSARHTVKTNSIGLVSNEISSYERPLYNQRIPYDVLLKIENKISSPVISFGLDLPERYRTTYPTLDSKLNFLNQPNMESERNKQVFALLVGGTFIPEDPSMTEGSGGSNFATTAARNSVNAIMTQQLNNFTGQFIEGLDVDMGVNTFDDYGTGKAQTRTQLDVKVSKNLFNDRVTAEMESHINLDGSVKEVGQQSTAGMTEFAVSYKLTESGNYRIKGFRENAYDIFDGEIQNSGIAFIFIKEFESFRKKQKQDDPRLIEKEEDEESKD
jgi:hypothetical protein